MKPKLLCTLGPASLNSRSIKRLEDVGASLFRLNLSHISLRDIGKLIDLVQDATSIPLCLDTEGAQIRTGAFVEGVVAVRGNSQIRAEKRLVPGDANVFNFYPSDIIDALMPGDFISIDFNAVLVQVSAKTDDGVTMRVINGGPIGSNKAVTVNREIAMPALTEKDLGAIEIGLKKGVDHFALSFANHGEDVDMLRGLIGPDAFLISKIESIGGLTHLDEIAKKSNALLIDRGDLSRQIPVERVPSCQKQIISRAKELGRPVYVATNLLESMVTAPGPTRAEVNDIYNSLRDGADGLVLAAETAIGKYPIRCAGTIVKMMQTLNEDPPLTSVQSLSVPVSLLTEPHGGTLIERIASNEDIEDIDNLARLAVDDQALLDCEQIAAGTFSPLCGFMSKDTLYSVLQTNRMPNDLPWTMPVVLPIDGGRARNISLSEPVLLTDHNDIPRAILNASEVYPVDLEGIAQLWFGTLSTDHPGAKKLLSGPSTFIAGDIVLIKKGVHPYQHFELTPRESRYVFHHKGWSQVLGFHSRNPAHRVHEYIQKKALELSGADGLLINPVIGPKKPGDFLAGPIIMSYQALMEFGIYPPEQAVFSVLHTYPRYCGPREAVFTALCRKNMGCSHFVVGRDHAGVGDFYSDINNRQIFDDLDDLGIEPIFFDNVGYSEINETYGTLSDTFPAAISGSEVRQRLLNGEAIPEWYMRDIVQQIMAAETHAGRDLFYEGPLNNDTST